MRLLMDTHTLIWHYEDQPLLSDRANHALDNPDNELFISTASLWEMAIKISSGKLKLAVGMLELINIYRRIGVDVLPITPEHALATENLPWHHRDPFDRMLIAQAICEGLSLISRDSQFADYPVPVVW